MYYDSKSCVSIVSFYLHFQRFEILALICVRLQKRHPRCYFYFFWHLYC